MTYVLLLVFSAIVLLVCLLAVRGYSCRIQDIDELEKHIQPVDLAAFRNLVDPREEEYLRMRLSQRDFCIVQRKRALAAIAYIRCTARNAAILLRLGETARSSPDPEIAKAALKLVNSALWVRIYAWLALCSLCVVVVFPHAHISSGGFVHAYENLSDLVARFARLERPAHAVRISAML